MKIPSYQDLLKAGVHLGHLSRKWDPRMSTFIFMESKGMHVIDLNKTIEKLKEANEALLPIVNAGRKVLFVATKKQARNLVADFAHSLNMPYITERWLGGTLTNFITIRKLIKKLNTTERIMNSVSYKNRAKKEQLMIGRNQAKLDQLLKGIIDLTKLPGALIVVDSKKENIAIAEARKLGIPVIAIVDTNANPDLVDYPIPANDDATPAIEIVLRSLAQTIAEGLVMREETKSSEDLDKDASQTQPNQEKQDPKTRRVRGVQKVNYTDFESEETNESTSAPRNGGKPKRIPSDSPKPTGGKPTRSAATYPTKSRTPK